MNRRDLLKLAATGVVPTLVRDASGALIPPFFLDCVVAIGLRPWEVIEKPKGKKNLKRGDFTPSGSGFLYGHLVERVDETNNRYTVFLVTNKHVVEGLRQQTLAEIQRLVKQGLVQEGVLTARVFLRFNPAGGGSARDFGLTLQDVAGKSEWLAHDTADVSVVRLNAAVLVDCRRDSFTMADAA